MKKAFTFLIFGFLAVNVFSQWAHEMLPQHYCSQAKIQSQKDYVFKPADQTDLLFDYDVKFYFLDISVERNSIYVSGNVTINAVVISVTLDTFAVELVPELTVDSVVINGQLLAHSHNDDEIYIPLPSPLSQGDDITAQVFYHGTPPTGGFFYGIHTAHSSAWDKDVTWTLSEPFAAKEWWPTKQVLEDKADSVWVFITTDQSNKAGSQGLLKAVTPMGNNKMRYEWKSGYTIDYYLISVAVSEYQEYNIYAKPAALGGDSILIQNYIYDSPGCLAYYQDGIDNTIEFIELFSDLYGLYPFYEEKYGHCLAQMGGMEHQTMTTIGSFNFGLVSHELGHMWFGDNVTCATWSDIWINEGFATYSDYLAHEKIAGPPWPAIWLENVHSNVMSQPGGSVYIPPSQATNIWRIFDSRLSYNKGASIIHMIRFELQDDSVFFKVLQDFQVQFRDSVATGLDFKGVLEDVSGMDFTDFFEQWYFGEGYPIYEIVWNQDNGYFNMNVTQTTSFTVTTLFKMLMPYKLNFDDGSSITLLLYQTDNFNQFSVPISKTIDSIEVDPDLWVLDKVTSIIIGIEEIENPVHFTFGPNPIRDNLNIFLSHELNREVQVIITDLSGREIFRSSVPDRKINLNVSGMSKGVYFIRIYDGVNTLTKKFIKI